MKYFYERNYFNFIILINLNQPTEPPEGIQAISHSGNRCSLKTSEDGFDDCVKILEVLSLIILNYEITLKSHKEVKKFM